MEGRAVIPIPTGGGAQRLACNSLMTMSAYGVYAVCLWGMLIAAAKIADPESVGQFALGLSISTPIVMFCNLQLRAAQVTDALSRFSPGEYLALRLISTASAACAIALVAVTVSGFSSGALVIAAVGLGKCIEALGDNLQGLFQRNSRMDWFSFSLLLKSILPLASFVTALHTSHDMTISCVSYAAAMAAVTVLYDVPRARKLAGTGLRLDWTSHRLRDLAQSALPLGFAALLSAGVAQIPKYAVTYFWGTRDFAVFAAVSYFVSGAQLIATAINQAALPNLTSQWFLGNRSEFRSTLLSMSALAGVLGVAGMTVAALAGRQILTFLYRPEYAEYTELLHITMAACVVLSIGWILTNALQAARLFREQMMVFAAGCASTLLASIALVPRYGLAGAAVAMLIGSAVQVVSSVVFLWSEVTQTAPIPSPSRSR